MPETMRAVGITGFGGPEVLEVVELPRPKLRRGMVAIRVHAAAVSPADVGLRSDGGKAIDAGDDGPGVLSGPPPWVPGMDAAGVVTAVGEPGAAGPTDLLLGDRVMTIVVPFGDRPGAMAEYVAVPAESAVRIPGGLSFEEASTIPMNALTAWIVRREFALPAGASVAVTGGAGFLASMFIALAAHSGVRVIADAAPVDEELVRSYGAHTVVPRDGDFAQRVRTVVPGGVDAVFDTACLRQRALPAIRDGGLIICARPWSGETERGIDHRTVVVGYEAKNHAALAEIAGLVADGVLRPRVAKVFAPADAAGAHHLMEAGGIRGRAVVDFSALPPA